MKKKVVYICRECSYKSPRWLGKCPNCNAWNSFDETIDDAGARRSSTGKSINSATVVKLSDISTDKQYRIHTTIK
ncbi:MAG: DNA repair protein RadA, partial [Ignavibacteria bacterium]|nr:DNA repair protein RadA [Ignavibacteria bacterium]